MNIKAEKGTLSNIDYCLMFLGTGNLKGIGQLLTFSDQAAEPAFGHFVIAQKNTKETFICISRHMPDLYYPFKLVQSYKLPTLFPEKKLAWYTVGTV